MDLEVCRAIEIHTTGRDCLRGVDLPRRSGAVQLVVVRCALRVALGEELRQGRAVAPVRVLAAELLRSALLREALVQLVRVGAPHYHDHVLLDSVGIAQPAVDEAEESDHLGAEPVDDEVLRQVVRRARPEEPLQGFGVADGRGQQLARRELRDADDDPARGVGNQRGARVVWDIQVETYRESAGRVSLYWKTIYT